MHHHVEEMKDSDNKDRLPNMPKGGGEADDHHEVVAERSTMNHDHSIIGISLVAGFIFMLLVDQLGGYMHSKSSTGKYPCVARVQVSIHVLQESFFVTCILCPWSA